jgi:hypothetical protein
MGGTKTSEFTESHRTEASFAIYKKVMEMGGCNSAGIDFFRIFILYTIYPFPLSLSNLTSFPPFSHIPFPSLSSERATYYVTGEQQ